VSLSAGDPFWVNATPDQPAGALLVGFLQPCKRLSPLAEGCTKPFAIKTYEYHWCGSGPDPNHLAGSDANSAVRNIDRQTILVIVVIIVVVLVVALTAIVIVVFTDDQERGRPVQTRAGKYGPSAIALDPNQRSGRDL